ncbi:MAG TPA: GGDEF domain-containing protein [Streptosporangiaceae bacterium]|nr:GGDEF domain-containing protein [Streptosporangiaceae bacterium]
MDSRLEQDTQQNLRARAYTALADCLVASASEKDFLETEKILLECRTDPTTGLYAFTDFVAVLPRLIASYGVEVGRSGGVGLAVGDVDGLKSLIEAPPDPVSGLSGHIRGNHFMSTLGDVIADFAQQLGSYRVGIATFGGDEIVLAMPAPCPMSFATFICGMRESCCRNLPLTISFMWTWIRAGGDGGGLPANRDYYAVLMALDRALVQRKLARRPGSKGSFCESCDLMPFMQEGGPKA